MTPADSERLADEIAELAAHLDAATHRLLTLIGLFDEAGGWADQGALTCAHWLSWRVGLDLGAAREHVRVARALRALPQIDEALRRGQVSYSKVRALTRVAAPENEGALLAMARASTASQLERICRGYRRALRHAADEQPADDLELRWVRERETETGLVRFDIQLTVEEAAVVRRALEVAASRAWRSGDVPAGTRPSSARRVDALVAVAEQYLSGGAEDAGPPVEVVVHVDAASDAGGTLEDGSCRRGASAHMCPRSCGRPDQPNARERLTPVNENDTVCATAAHAPGQIRGANELVVSKLLETMRKGESTQADTPLGRLPSLGRWPCRP